jgi:hypothetical protein
MSPSSRSGWHRLPLDLADAVSSIASADLVVLALRAAWAASSRAAYAAAVCTSWNWEAAPWGGVVHFVAMVASRPC